MVKRTMKKRVVQRFDWEEDMGFLGLMKEAMELFLFGNVNYGNRMA